MRSREFAQPHSAGVGSINSRSARSSKSRALVLCLCACLVSPACSPGPSSSDRDRAAKEEEAEAATLERNAEFLGGLLGRRHAASNALDALAAALPDRAWLTEVVFDPKGIQVRGNAPSNYALSDYISRLGESPSLADTILRGSSLRTVRGRESVEFLLQMSVRVQAVTPPGDSAAARLEELEKALSPPQDDAGMLRELQMLALEAGLQMTRFAPGVERAGEFTSELPVAIEVAGEPADLGRYLRGLAGLERLWVVERFSFKAVSPADPRSEVRASIAAAGHFAR